MHAISSYRGNRPTHPHTHTHKHTHPPAHPATNKQTGPGAAEGKEKWVTISTGDDVVPKSL